MDWDPPDEPYVASDYNESGISSSHDDVYQLEGEMFNICVFFNGVFGKKNLFINKLYSLIEGTGGVFNLGYHGISIKEREQIAKLVIKAICTTQEKKDTYIELGKIAKLNMGMCSRKEISQNKIKSIVGKSACSYRQEILEALINKIKNRHSPLAKIINLDRGFGFTLFGPMKSFSSDTRPYQDLLHAIEESNTNHRNTIASGVSLRR